jgi:hypothetical protein
MRRESGKELAYVRVKDENILATTVHLKVWQQSGSPTGVLVEFTQRNNFCLICLRE